MKDAPKTKASDAKLAHALAARLEALHTDMLHAEALLANRALPLHKCHQQSARNLTHYLALRRHDIRNLQAKLAVLGLSSLGRTEGHVLDAIESVHGVLNSLNGTARQPLPSIEPAIKMGEGSRLLKANTNALLGPEPSGRNVRIMVTVPTEASTNYELVRDLLRSGMDCMRINCAHDSPDVWLKMIRNLEKAKKETRRLCRVEMDLAGPKLRTGPIEPGRAVIRCRPQRDEFGRVTKPALIWLTPTENPCRPPQGVTATIQLPLSFLEKLHRNDIVRFRDARDSKRSLRITKTQGPSRLAQINQTAYFIPGIELHVAKRASKATSWSARVGPIPPSAQTILLKSGESLLLTRSLQSGKPALRDSDQRITSTGQIGVTLPGFFDHAKAGQPIWFDDGKIGGLIRSVTGKSVLVEITQARPEGEKLGGGKGINLPDTRVDTPALTTEDIEHLKFIVQYADIVGYSFVRTEDDIRQLLKHLQQPKGKSLRLVLKIETREAFENLPGLILTAMALPSVGVMIARGDLAVECGYQRLAEVQEEILWICEAAHIPVIWATQVLETLAKTGIPSRSEITDAAMGERAECVMLNKGPYAVSAVKVLDDILKRMQMHQQKKRSMLRKLRIASLFASVG